MHVMHLSSWILLQAYDRGPSVHTGDVDNSNSFQHHSEIINDRNIDILIQHLEWSLLTPSLNGKSCTHPCSPVWKWPPFLQQNTELSAQMNPLFHGKTLNIKINPFFSKFKEVSTKIPPFSRKMRILDFLNKYPFIHEF